jgi:hypothetical protein
MTDVSEILEDIYALSNERKNIGKQASKDRTIAMETQESFITPLSTDVELFREHGVSSIIDDVLGG